jgi:hypothetical protein
MSFQNLHDDWTRPDNSHLTAKQLSFRLPVHVAAKLAALCELYPSRNRTQIVADLLSLAIDHLEQNMPVELGKPLPDAKTDDGQKVFYGVGVRADFRTAANNCYAAYEEEQGIQQPGTLYGPLLVTEKMVTEKGSGGKP